MVRTYPNQILAERVTVQLQKKRNQMKIMIQKKERNLPLSLVCGGIDCDITSGWKALGELILIILSGLKHSEHEFVLDTSVDDTSDAVVFVVVES